MYNPKDTYIQTLINNGIRILKDAINESLDKQQTREDIVSKLEKEFGFEIFDN